MKDTQILVISEEKSKTLHHQEMKENANVSLCFLKNIQSATG